MIRLFTIFIGSIILSMSTGGTKIKTLSNNQDSVRASNYFKRAIELQRLNKLDSSIILFKKSRELYAKQPQWSDYIKASRGLAISYIYLDKFDSAKMEIQNGLSLFTAKQLSDTVLYKMLLNVQGGIFSITNQLDSGIIVMEKLLALDKQFFGDSVSLELGGTYNNLGTLYTDYRVLDKALNYYDSAMSIYFQLSGKESEHAARLYSNRAIVLKLNGNFDEAISSNIQSYEIFKKVMPEGHPRLALALFNIAHDFIDRNERIEDIHRGMDYLRQGEQILSFADARSHRYITDYHRYLAKGLKLLGRNEMAITHLDSAFYISESINGRNNMEQAFIRQDLADLHINMASYDLAENHLEKAAEIFNSQLSNKYHRMAEIYASEGFIDYKRGNLNEALGHYQRALMYFSSDIEVEDPKTNPNPRNLIVNNVLMDIMERKAMVFEAQYQASKMPETLKQAFDTYMVLQSYLDLAANGIYGYGSRLKFNQRAEEILKNGIKVAIQYYRLTEDKMMVESILKMADKYKSNLLLASLEQSKAKKNYPIPTALMDRQQKLRADIEFSKKALFELSAVPQKDSISIKQIELKLFGLEADMELHSKEIKNLYPAYHQTQFNRETKSISWIQNNLLTDNSLLVEYVEVDSTFFAILLGKNLIDLVEIPATVNIQREVPLLLNSIKSKKLDSFVQTSFQLNNVLIQPVLQKANDRSDKIQKLIIIPEGILGYIPFEALVASMPSNSQGYKNLNYLIKNFEVSYHYSVNLLAFDTQVQKSSNKSAFLGFAPSFIDKVGPQYLSLNERTRAFIDTLTALPDAEKEVVSIAQLLDGEAQVGIAATEHNFKQLAGNYKILHLASHSIIEDEEPMYSKLLFDNEQDSVEDGFLHTYELYNMNLNADLVTLSSCNTGVGKLYKGEGIMSLARGFMYAGVPNLVMSLWSVSDKPTKDLMTYFYEEMKNGETKSAALRKAKLRYIEQADNYTANPYYWSSFIYLGQVEKEKGLSKQYIWLSFLALFAVLSLAFIWNRRKRAAN